MEASVTRMFISIVLLSSVHAAVLQHHLPGAVWPTDGEEPPHSAVVSLCVHVPVRRLLWLPDGGPSGQQTGEVKGHMCHAVPEVYAYCML